MNELRMMDNERVLIINWHVPAGGAKKERKEWVYKPNGF